MYIAATIFSWSVRDKTQYWVLKILYCIFTSATCNSSNYASYDGALDAGQCALSNAPSYDP